MELKIADTLNADDIVPDGIHKCKQHKIHHQFLKMPRNAWKVEKIKYFRHSEILYDPISQKVFLRWLPKFMVDIMHFC